ncbi:unnamed protein product [Ceutorhynchus assimilis]|uniref:Ferritin n=1 Tax=Ceutorhynchus assimilis TaxID=467358 RepID=A0A9N9QL21_9CUCU|nr:unnamed protein product [Ceutorhynchus assimilis]
MALLNTQTRIFKLLFTFFEPHSKLHTKIHKDIQRNLSSKPKNSSFILYRGNLSNFYNDSKVMYNVSTYENLVKQKSGSDDNKCTARGKKEFPGRHKFHKEVESALNDQIEVEFTAAFAYLSMAAYYGRSEVALPGCQGFFMNMHREEHEHALIFLNYVLMRGGHVKVPSLKPPDNEDWKDIMKSFGVAVAMECCVKEKMEDVVELAEKHKDHQLNDFISSDFLEEQNKSIQLLGRLFTRSKMVNTDVGEYLFDQHLYESFVKQSKDNYMYLTKLSDEEEKKVYK